MFRYSETSLAPTGPRLRADLDGAAGTNGFGIGYDAIHHKGRRATPMARVLSEDLELRQLPRRNLTTNVRDLNRNFAIAAWMIRKHADYVASFHFRSKTGIPAVDDQVNAFMTWWGRRENCDCAGRHNLARLMRMWEVRRVIDGDVILNRLAVPVVSRGGKPPWHGTIQTIEGDRIQTWGGIPFDELGIKDPTRVVNGVWIDAQGRDLAYMVFKRLPLWSGLQWDRMVSAEHADLHGYFDRYDQVRGISPLAAACNTLRDVYEAADYALVKAKVAQFLGVLFTRAASEDMGVQENREGEADADGDPDKPRYDVDLGRGPVALDMEPGDDVKVIESQQPSEQFQNFSKIMIMVALKALDIPFSFFDESHTNFSGMQQAKVQYVESCKIKQQDNRSLLDRQTRWRLGVQIQDGDAAVGPRIKLPPGMTADDLRWQWSHSGVPMYDSLKEMSGAIAAVNAGLSSTVREAQKLGLDAYELLEENAAFQAAAKARGVVISTAIASIAAVDPNQSKTQKEAVTETDEEEESEPRDNGKPGQGGRQNLWGGV